MFCSRAKEFLSQHNLGFIERDVASDPAAFAELERLGYLTTSVILIDGEVVVGFDRARLETLLGVR